ncbi:MAG: hypothetical protein N2201_02075 [candidate division WOR-3 bacterium]|nr:hypothetical protein [candidate division WOR-3 bacterium]
MDLNRIQILIESLAKIGRESREAPSLYNIEPFRHFYFQDGRLNVSGLDDFDGKFSRREILVRYLLLKAVLDQGPDMVGVNELLSQVISSLYRREIRIFHRPIDFFQELGITIDQILEKHNSVKAIRANLWAKSQNTRPTKYNLFFAQSSRGIVPIKQVLDYSIHRWGVPLCIPLLLENDLQKEGKESKQPLIDYLESYASAEIMAQGLKDHYRYGLGSAIGDKACHLFAKMYVSVFNLVKHKINDTGWTDISYETPFDSNAGRVLFRTGFLLEFANLEDYKKWNVIQKRIGKEGMPYYIRVTNIRGKKTQKIKPESELFTYYKDIVNNYLKIGMSPRAAEIQRMPTLILYILKKKGYHYSIADFDDGLMKIGTEYCKNNTSPKCQNCPIKQLCFAFNKDKSLIKEYWT